VKDDVWQQAVLYSRLLREVVCTTTRRVAFAVFNGASPVGGAATLFFWSIPHI